MDAFQFNVSHLLREASGITARYTVNTADPLTLDDGTTKNIAGAVELLKTSFGILARAKLDATIDLDCDRCLEPYTASISTGFEEEYLPVIDVSTGRPVQSERIDQTFFISPNHIVDLTEAARQHLLLALPMHGICREDCLGLCPICGANKNILECGCVEEADHPLSAIATLLRDVTEPSG